MQKREKKRNQTLPGKALTKGIQSDSTALPHSKEPGTRLGVERHYQCLLQFL
jgi:hypothetical protein